MLCKLVFLVLLVFLTKGKFFVYWVDLFLIYVAVLSLSPLFLILVFVIYLLCFGVSLIFLINTYYYSYIIFLMFFSGLLVMFMYVCSIISNEKIYLKFNFFFFLLGLGLFFLSVDKSEFILLSFTNLLYGEFYNLLKFFIFSFSLFSVFFVFYLFLCLIVIYEVIKKNVGPLRMSFN